MIVFYIFLYLSFTGAFTELYLDKRTKTYEKDNIKENFLVFLVLTALGPFSYLFLKRLTRYRKLVYLKTKLNHLEKLNKDHPDIVYILEKDFESDLKKYRRLYKLNKLNKLDDSIID